MEGGMRWCLGQVAKRKLDLAEPGEIDWEQEATDPRMAKGPWVSSTLPSAPSYLLLYAASASDVSYAWFAWWASGCFVLGTVDE